MTAANVACIAGHQKCVELLQRLKHHTPDSRLLDEGDEETDTFSHLSAEEDEAAIHGMSPSAREVLAMVRAQRLLQAQELRHDSLAQVDAHESQSTASSASSLPGAHQD